MHNLQVMITFKKNTKSSHKKKAPISWLAIGEGNSTSVYNVSTNIWLIP